MNNGVETYARPGNSNGSIFCEGERRFDNEIMTGME
jgi:hypothetical protein